MTISSLRQTNLSPNPNILNESFTSPGNQQHPALEPSYLHETHDEAGFSIPPPLVLSTRKRASPADSSPTLSSLNTPLHQDSEHLKRNFEKEIEMLSRYRKELTTQISHSNSSRKRSDDEYITFTNKLKQSQINEIDSRLQIVFLEFQAALPDLESDERRHSIRSEGPARRRLERSFEQEKEELHKEAFKTAFHNANESLQKILCKGSTYTNPLIRKIFEETPSFKTANALFVEKKNAWEARLLLALEDASEKEKESLFAEVNNIEKYLRPFDGVAILMQIFSKQNSPETPSNMEGSRSHRTSPLSPARSSRSTPATPIHALNTNQGYNIALHELSLMESLIGIKHTLNLPK